jgi:hypothetical protein
MTPNPLKPLATIPVVPSVHGLVVINDALPSLLPSIPSMYGGTNWVSVSSAGMPSSSSPSQPIRCPPSQWSTYVPEGERSRSDQGSSVPGFRFISECDASGTTRFSESAPTSWLPGNDTICEQPRKSPCADTAREEFERQYPYKPERAISRVLKQVARWESEPTTNVVSPIEAAAILLAHLPRASYGRQNLLVDALLCSIGPRAIVQGALAASETSGPDVLRAAAGLLEHYASDAWPTLERLASSNRRECRYFVRQTAVCEGISEALRVQAMTHLARNSDSDTRSEVVEALESGLLTDAAPVWRVLATAPEESIRSLAASRLEAFRE